MRKTNIIIVSILVGLMILSCGEDKTSEKPQNKYRNDFEANRQKVENFYAFMDSASNHRGVVTEKNEIIQMIDITFGIPWDSLSFTDRSLNALVDRGFNSSARANLSYAFYIWSMSEGDLKDSRYEEFLSAAINAGSSGGTLHKIWDVIPLVKLEDENERGRLEAFVALNEFSNKDYMIFKLSNLPDGIVMANFMNPNWWTLLDLSQMSDMIGIEVGQDDLTRVPHLMIDWWFSPDSDGPEHLIHSAKTVEVLDVEISDPWFEHIMRHGKAEHWISE